MSRLRSIDLFAGIGGIRIGFDNAFGDDIETVFVSEWDEYAKKTYRANFDDDFEIAGDITKIEEKDIPEFDICLAGFPCQAFSLAGQRKGFEDDYKGMSRGTLFFDVARICEYHKPKVIFCENVKGLAIHDRGRTFKVIVGTLEELGYTVYHKVLNSKDFGVPQNRERIYIVAFRKDLGIDKFEFPEPTDTTKKIRDIIEENPVPAKYYLSTQYMQTLINHKARHERKGNGFGYEIREQDGVAGAIVCGGMGRERNLIIDKRQKDLTPTTHIKGEVNKDGIRKMTPREWARLQGFPDSFKLTLADTHLYKQFGNSVSVPVIRAIAERIKDALDAKKGDDNIMWKYNKGEWSEIYTFAYLLSSGILYAADEDLNKVEDVFFPIIRIIREETQGNPIDYYTGETIKIFENETLLKEVGKGEFETIANILLEKIPTGSRAFEIPEAEEFFENVYCKKVKANSAKKEDITAQLHDINTGIKPICGFSIKSYLGANPTLINPGINTNFGFVIDGCTDEIMEEVNNINTRTKLIDKMNTLLSYGCSFSLIPHSISAQFEENLQFIDSKMPEFLHYMVLYSYVYNVKTTVEILEKMKDHNPLGFANREMYTYKYKKLLAAWALGLTPERTDWLGTEDANGGYITVKSNGEVVCYHLYNRTQFEQYLYDYTVFDRPSTSKYHYFDIYKENGVYKVKFCLQVRFK